ncbi:hypothetical protein [Vibrio campbellii]|uniref:hypothetical protein n=1 Tax=Vibrio campbellii TaxID=680 RepID=UPI0005EF17B1|nr:hypothetical protein [Vibrio campbellii]
MENSDCPHCSGSGSCTLDDGNSCGSCMKTAKIKTDHKIVRCGVCSGTGSLTRPEIQMNERAKLFSPLVVLSLVLLVFYLGSFQLLSNDEYAAQVYTAIVSLTSVIVSFYFGTKK